MNLFRQLTLVALLAFTLGSVGCTTGFRAQWAEMAEAESMGAAPEATPTSAFMGRWIGTWESTRDGHSGRLRAIITERGAYQYDANFHATFAWIVPVFKKVVLNGVLDQTADTPRLRVHGLLVTDIGDYTYSGYITADEFVADYTSDGGDYGTFTLHRPAVEPEPMPEPEPAAEPAPEAAPDAAPADAPAEPAPAAEPAPEK